MGLGEKCEAKAAWAPLSLGFLLWMLEMWEWQVLLVALLRGGERTGIIRSRHVGFTTVVSHTLWVASVHQGPLWLTPLVSADQCAFHRTVSGLCFRYFIGASLNVSEEHFENTRGASYRCENPSIGRRFREELHGPTCAGVH